MRTLISVLLTVLVIVGPAHAQSAEEQLAEASALFDARRFPQAVQKLDQFLAAHPRHEKAGAAALALGRCHTELRQFDRAVPAYEKAVASKDPTVQAAAQLGLGEAAVQTAQWEKALTALSGAATGPLKPEQAAVVWYWLGEANFELKRYAPAEEAYLKVTREHGGHELAGSAAYGAAVAALRLENRDAARRHLRLVTERYPKSEDRPQALLLLAQLDLEEKRHREARSGFEALLKDSSRAAREPAIRHPAEEGLIQALVELEEYGAAAGHLESLVARLPARDAQRARAQLTLGTCRFHQKQYAQAQSAYREAASASDPAIAGEAQYWAANTSLALGRAAEAAAQFAQLVERFPNHPLAPRAQLKSGDAFLNAMQADAASRAYQRLLERYPDAPQAGEARKALADLADTISDPVQLAALLKTVPPGQRAQGSARLARLYLEARKPAEAEQAVAALIKDVPAAEVPAEVHYLLGLARDAQRKPEPAAASLSEAVRREPKAPWAADAQTRLAWLHLDLKQAAAAERAATASLALKPEAAVEQQARLALIQSFLAQEKWQPALEGCKNLLSASPEAEAVPMLLFTQAWIHEKLEQPAQALPLWEQILSRHRRSEYAAEALVRTGDARFKAQKYAEARDQYAAVLAEHAQSPLAHEARFKLGTALYHLDRHAEAAAEWDRVAAEKTAAEWVPEALYWAGVALDRVGKKPEAIQRLERLVSQFPRHNRVATARVRLAALKAVAQ